MNPPISPRTLFSQVMETPVNNRQVPASKPQGVIAQKKQDPLTKREGALVNFSRVVLDADAGADSEQKRQNFFARYLKSLSRPQLKRLARKIRRLQKNFLKGSPEEEAVSALANLTEQSVHERLQSSEILFKRLQNKALKQFWDLLPLPIQVGGKSHLFVLLEGECVSFDAFLRRMWQPILERMSEALMEGNIIPPRANFNFYTELRKQALTCLQLSRRPSSSSFC